MHAAVVRSFDAPPRYEAISTPDATGEHDLAVEVLAAALHPRVRATAESTHYTTGPALPLVPGIDAVARSADGQLLYVVASDGPLGTMAERAVVDRRCTVPLPAGADPVTVAAAVDPALSSWVALRRRVPPPVGGSVLVLGATGNAGSLAVQIARRLGAERVVAAGRDPARLARLADLGADALVGLEDADAADRLGEAAGDVDVVLDYLWGPPTETAMSALVRSRTDRSRPLAWIELGSAAGQDVALASWLLRAANLSVTGSGQGAVSTAGILAELPDLLREIASGALVLDPLPVPLDRVEQAWAAPAPAGRRIVFVP